jgi:hypothetical protein
LNTAVLLDMPPYNLIDSYESFGGINRLPLQHNLKPASRKLAHVFCYLFRERFAIYTEPRVPLYVEYISQ